MRGEGGGGMQKFGVRPVHLKCLLDFHTEMLRQQGAVDCEEKPGPGYLYELEKHSGWLGRQDTLVNFP
jgi:hypothetical protein